jgi:hypothetical protein
MRAIRARCAFWCLVIRRGCRGVMGEMDAWMDCLRIEFFILVVYPSGSYYAFGERSANW